MHKHFVDSINATHDSLRRINATTDPHLFNQFKALEFMAYGLGQVLHSQAQELAALRSELHALRQRLQ